MSINFADLLGQDQKKELLSARIQQLAVEGYQLQLNRIVIEGLENNETALEVLDENVKAIEQGLTVYQQELNNLQ